MIYFQEPESAEELAKQTRRFLIPVVIFLLIVIFLSIKITRFFGVRDVINILGIILISFSILLHEYLHDIFFKKMQMLKCGVLLSKD